MEKKRTLMWVGFLAGASILAVIPDLFWEDELLVQQVAKTAHEQPDEASFQPPVPEIPAAQPATHSSDEQQAIPRADLFPAHSWYVAPAAPVIPPLPTAPRVVAPSAPAAPPVPFQFVGTLNDEDRLHIVLMRGQRMHIVSVGDVIDETYRVEGLRGREVILVYLPMDLSQSILVGSASGSRL